MKLEYFSHHSGGAGNPEALKRGQKQHGWPGEWIHTGVNVADSTSAWDDDRRVKLQPSAFGERLQFRRLPLHSEKSILFVSSRSVVRWSGCVASRARPAARQTSEPAELMARADFPSRGSKDMMARGGRKAA